MTTTHTHTTTRTIFSPEQVAEICHEANRAVQRILGEQVNFPWENCSPNLRDSAVDGVSKILSGEVTTPQQSHDNWIKFKIADGWQWGEVKDFAAKTHPDLVPYDELPPEQTVKDAVFFAIVRALGDG